MGFFLSEIKFKGKHKDSSVGLETNISLKQSTIDF